MCKEFCSWNEETHLGDLAVDGNVVKLTIRNFVAKLWSRYIWLSDRKHDHNNEVPGPKTKAWVLSTSLLTISCWWSQFLQLEYIKAQHWSVHSHSQKSCMWFGGGGGEGWDELVWMLLWRCTNSRRCITCLSGLGKTRSVATIHAELQKYRTELHTVRLLLFFRQAFVYRKKSIGVELWVWGGTSIAVGYRVWCRKGMEAFLYPFIHVEWR